MPARAHPEWLTWGFKFTSYYFSHHIRIRQARLVSRICCPAHVQTCPTYRTWHASIPVPRTSRPVPRPRVSVLFCCCLPVHVQTCPGTARVLSRLHMSRPVPLTARGTRLYLSRARPDLSRDRTCPYLFTCTCPDLSRYRTCSKSSAHVQTCPATARARTCCLAQVQTKTCPANMS